jgi:hypothetical protein
VGVKLSVHSAILAGAALLFIAVVVWLVREPRAELVVPPLHPPRLKVAAVAKGGDGLESEAGAEDAPMLPVGTVELPETLDRRQLEAGMAKVKKFVEKCRELQAFDGTVTVKLVIATNGNVQTGTLVSPPERNPLTDCVVKAARRASFPRFRGTLLPTVDLTYPFRFGEPKATL